MSRISDGAKRSAFIFTLMIAALLGSACEDIEGRNGNRRGNRLFQDMQFIDAAAAYERALQQVPDPIIHYNLGLAYSKMYRPGYDRPILLGEMTEPLCKEIPEVQPVEEQVCIKRLDAKDQSDRRRFNECDEKDVCPSSFECKKTTLCAASSPKLADLAAKHLKTWIDAQPSDEALAAELKKVREQLKDAQADHEKRLAGLPQGNEDAKTGEIQRNKAVMDELNRRVDELTLKDDMRKLMTQAWMDTSQFDKALDYWQSELKAKPNNAGITGNIAGIYLKANDWRKSIEWYLKAAEMETEPDLKAASLYSIGYIAWSKLNSKTLNIDESIEVADFGIAACQKAATIQPKAAKPYSLQASILNFRSLTHGSSFASAIDRAHAQDLLKLSRVLIEEAKKQQQGQAPVTPGATPTPPPAPTPQSPSPSAPPPPAPASPSMSGGPAPKTGG